MRLYPRWGRRRRTQRWRRTGAPRVWAHRGDSAHVLENTLEAFASARTAGADGLEFDVRACRGGDVVVFHDDDLARLAGRPDRVAELTLSELRALPLRGGLRVPTLAEVLDAFDDLELNVELKSPGAGKAGDLPVAVAAALRGVRDPERILVSSFDPWALVQLHGVAPAIATALLVHAGEPWIVRRGWLGPWLGAGALHPEHVLCTPASVAAWRRAGFAVNTWTVDDPARLRELAAMGVDGVFANDPAAARAALAG